MPNAKVPHKTTRYAEAVAMRIGEGKSWQEVADTIGIQRKTLWEWRQTLEFRMIEDQVSAGVIEQARRDLRNLAIVSIRAIEDCLEPDQDEARVKCNMLRLHTAKLVLDRLDIGEKGKRSPIAELPDEDLDRLIEGTLDDLGYVKKAGESPVGGVPN